MGILITADSGRLQTESDRKEKLIKEDLITDLIIERNCPRRIKAPERFFFKFQ